MERNLALPLDDLISDVAHRERPPLPPEAPLAMPAQRFRPARAAPRRAPRPAVWLGRVLALGGALALSLYGGHQMVLVISAGEVTPLEWLMMALFAVTFSWIALAAASAVAGVLLGRWQRPRSDPATPLAGRTALVMPVYNEDPAATVASLEAMARSLAGQGQGDRFEVFILSDSSDPEFWVAETAAFQALRAALGGQMAVWYRRRTSNRGRKSGNIQDFVERWGARYDFMVVLDADSIMAPETLVALVREIEADPTLGLVQTSPALAGGRSLFARLQQFAGRLYGPVVAAGIAAWQGDDGNYWGHNAIIRTRAFAAACGLPELAGRRPFGGLILSHDFVEAALLRRAGWGVRMLPGLDGSWEGSPPSLLDAAARDRRWAQGNLQHLAVLTAPGLAWPSRLHFLMGVMSYLASPLWLALVTVGLALAAQAWLIRPEYFTQEFQLFPTWPHFDSERMIRLFGFTMGVLLLPKLLGLLLALADRRTCRSLGAGLRLIAGALIEILLSALYAPILMLIQSRQVWEILLGRDSGWSMQRRAAGGCPWREAVRCHWRHALSGVAIAVAVWLVSPMLLVWMSPMLLGLAGAVALSKLSASERAGRLLRRLGLLVVPEERSLPAVMRLRDAAEARYRAVIAGTNLMRLVVDPRARAIHYQAVLPPAEDPRGSPRLERLSAMAKLNDAASPEEALQWLDKAEWMAVLSDSRLIAKLARSQIQAAE